MPERGASSAASGALCRFDPEKLSRIDRGTAVSR